MSNLGVMTAQILVLINNQLTTDQVVTLINAAQIEEVENHPWCRIKQETQINSFPAQTSIPINVTQGSATVTRTDSNLFPAITAGQIYLTVSPQVYAPFTVVANASPSATLTLEDPYPGPTASTTATLFQMFYSVPGYQEILGVRQQVVLGKKTHEWINDQDPYRQQVSGPAYIWAPAGRDSNDNVQVELWPIETSANGYTAYGLLAASLLVNPTDLPAIAAAVLVNKAAALCCDTLDALTGDPRWDRASKKYYGRYEKEWMKIQEADANQFGTIYQIQDARRAPSATGYNQPGLNQIYKTDYPGDYE